VTLAYIRIPARQTNNPKDTEAFNLKFNVKYFHNSNDKNENFKRHFLAM